MTTTYADKLRQFADYLDAHPVITELLSDWEYPSLYQSVDDWDAFQAAIRHLDGYDKSGYDGTLTAKHRETDNEGETLYSFTVSVSQVCEKVPMLDDNGEPVTRAKKVFPPPIVTDELEPVYEYKCPKVWTS